MSLMLAKNTPVVSVIVPTYNRAYCLAQTIQSVIDQSFSDWELILVDNYSTDGTDNLIANYSDPRIKCLKIQNGGIIAVSRNRGIRSALGKYIAFLDSDDGWLPDKLSTSVEALDRGSDLVYHDLYTIHKSNENSKKTGKLRTRNLANPIFNDLLLNGNAINNSSVVVRKYLLKQIGFISEDPELVAAEDYDTWLRISQITDRFERLKDCYGWYTIVNQNTSNSPQRSERNIKKIIEMYFDGPKNSHPAWINYALARACLKLGRYNESRLYALRVILGLPNNIFLIKALATYVLSCRPSIHVEVGD